MSGDVGRDGNTTEEWNRWSVIFFVQAARYHLPKFID